MADNKSRATALGNDMQKIVQDANKPEGVDEPLRAATFDERENFDSEWRVQAPDATKWVVYDPQPGVDYREISEADWKRAGVPDGQYLRWDKDNEWRVPATMLEFLGEPQFQTYILNDNRFRVVGE